MKIAVVYNHESKSVINLFGTPNLEKYGKKSIKRIVDALKTGGHQVIAFEGDKDLVDNLENFMPRVVAGERPGLVFNLSYGIQGQARYTHVPGILEMVGVPYVGSGPLAHSICLDKVVTKMIFRQHGLPTPDFAVLDDVDFPAPDMPYPLIIKPKNEAVSYGLAVVNNEDELRSAAGKIFDKFSQPALVERYIEGTEINVGVIGNNPVETFPAVELTFGEGPQIYTAEDKKRISGREIGLVCPARLPEKVVEQAKEIAIKAFKVVGAYDCARIDMRLDSDNNIYLLEINSLPSLGKNGSYVKAAHHVGFDFTALVNRLIAVAAARYFGSPEPPTVTPGKKNPSVMVFDYLTGRRDRIERRVAEWCRISSRTDDPVGHTEAADELGRVMTELDMKPVNDLTDQKSVWTWQTKACLDNGVLLLISLDTPLTATVSAQTFRRDPEWLYGEGIGGSRAPLTMMEFALRSLRAHRLLRRLPLGVMAYADEGRDCRYSVEHIAKAMERAGSVLVLRPGNMGDKAVTGRRGQRNYRLTVEGSTKRLGQLTKKPDALTWLFARMTDVANLSSRKERLAVGVSDVKVESFSMLLPHRARATVVTTFPDIKGADHLEQAIREKLTRKGLSSWRLDLESERPPMNGIRAPRSLFKAISTIADQWRIPFASETSAVPSVAGLSPKTTPTLCGLGPVAKEINTASEAVQRISLIQRTLLLAQYLATKIEEAPSGAGKKKKRN